MTKSVSFSEKSVVFPQLSQANTVSIGEKNPIEVPVLSIDKIHESIGKLITHGDVATIYKVEGSSSPRVYKAIPQDRFKNGDEIRISQIAADIGVAPAFYSAFLVKQGPKNFVVIEMEEGDKSLGKWMEDLAENSKPQGKKEVEEKPLTEKESAFQEMLKKIQAEMDAKYGTIVVTEIPQKNRLSLEDAVVKLYSNEESFYFELFNKIKILAKSHISYGDSHSGNILPNLGTEKGLQLIDFDGAKIWNNKVEAAAKSMQSNYNKIHFENFSKIPDLSDKSRKLIFWFLKESSQHYRNQLCTGEIRPSTKIEV